MWHVVGRGRGPAVALLHGIGMSGRVWEPVFPHLAGRRALAFDLPGFGRTPPLPDGVAPSRPRLAEALGETLREAGCDGPAHLVGNSLGGLVALEAAKRGLAASVTAISPGGLWEARRRPPATRLLKLMRWGSAHGPGLAAAAARDPRVREALFAVPLGPGARRMTADEAAAVLRDFADAPAFDATLNVADRFVGGREIPVTVPVTIAFGRRDRLLGRGCRRRDELPPHARWLDPPDWGHVPMWADPAGVARLILDGTAAG